MAERTQLLIATDGVCASVLLNGKTIRLNELELKMAPNGEQSLSISAPKVLNLFGDKQEFFDFVEKCMGYKMEMSSSASK